ncbi:hypothetical protein [Streptomyces cavernae]|uniref:hypothetical protein n=1 Tax=Streptomyces cavernae TaxID=2259034 RepID=UPI001EE41720|nr:hypothetical protein [Streptomyces cavernae]
MAKLAELVDAFTDPTINTVRWAGSSPGQYALDAERDLVTLNVGAAPNTYYSFGSGATYDATGSSLYAQMWPVLNGSATVSTSLKLDAGSNNAASIAVWGNGTFMLQITTGGVFANTPLPTYDPSAHRWWRLSESEGTFRVATSPDGQTWTTLASAPYAWDAASARVFFQTGTSTAQSAGQVAGIAHINTLAGGDSYPKVSTLQEPFTATSLNTGVWNSVSTGQYSLDTVNAHLLLNVGTTSGTYHSLGATGPYNATGSALYARVTPAPVGNGGITTVMKLDAGRNNAVQVLAASNGFFALQVQRHGNYVTVNLPPYDPHAHRWWRLTEKDSTLVFAVSADGWTWTDLRTLSYAWPFTSCQVYFQTGTNNDQPPGLAATIAHVNTRLGGQLNPAWPRVEDGWGAFWNANAGTQPLDRYVEVTDRTRGTVSVSRGRQYELDQVRSGEASLTLANTEGELDPVNTSGPWSGHIQPYQPYRRRAQWPPTVNLLDQGPATGGDGYPTGAIPTVAGGLRISSATDSSGGSIVATSAWQGSNVFQFSVPNGAAGFTRIGWTFGPGVVPGQTYTVQLRARNITPGTTLSVRAFIGSYTTLFNSNLLFGPPATLTGSANADWTTLTATVTIPAGRGAMSCGLALDSAAAAAACSIQVDGWQLEKGSTASAWQAPGVWYSVFAGFLERWPSSWDMDGLYGVVQPTAVDAFALLSQKTLSDPLTQEINSNSPRFLFKLDDPAGATSVADWTGTYPPAQLGISKYGAGSLGFGTAITSTGSGGAYTGSTGTVATLNNSNPGTNLISGGATFIKLNSAGITGPTNPTTWTRMIAFRYTGPIPTAAACLWSSMDRQRTNGPSGSHIYVYLGADGKPVLALQGPTGTGSNFYFGGATNCADGNWHLLIFGYSESSGQLRLAQDGVTTTVSGLTSSYTPTGIVGDSLGGFVDVTIGNGTTWNFKGDISFAAEFPGFLSPTAIANLYAAWKSACSGESTSARYARILRYAGYTGPATLQSGLTTSMGPANIEGRDAVSALQAVVETENGQHFVGTDSSVQFKARSARYNALTPTFTFGERADLGEWPYEDCTLDYDSTHLSNQVTVTQEATGQDFYATDATSVGAYFPRTMSRTINSQDANECSDAANYLLSRYRQPAQRVSTLKLHPSANPALWPVCLTLELGTRVRVMRRPPGAPTVQVDCFVENLQWSFSDNGEAWLELQCSPADLTPYGLLAAWHTTLASPIGAGVTSITVNASEDNTNPLAAQLAPGQRLVLGQNTANQETVTVAAVGATSPGWRTATVMLTTATTRAHTAGDPVCEPLPTGTTDPTTWDSVAVFDSIAFAY